MRISRALLPAVCLALAGCAGLPTPIPDESLNPLMSRYLALGDSYTIGQSVEESSRWPVLLQAELARAGCGDLSLTLVARSGWAAEDLRSAMNRESLAPAFDLITLQVGVNDQYRGHELEDFRADLARLLGEVGALAGGGPGRVIVVSIPDWSASPFGESSPPQTGREIDTFNTVLSTESIRRGFRFVDVTDLSRAVGQGEDYFADDGLHYSRLMHGRWVKRILPQACAALAGENP